MLDYNKKITTHREFYPIMDINISCESDRGRILSSPAFRRLQKRTQVFALELNAAVRTRLTHSLEVAQTSRYIARTVLSKLEKEGLDKYSLEDKKDAFISTCEMASLLHDIGNPPFGHFAEQTINKWIKENALPILNNLYSVDEKNKELKKQLCEDITNYDGNAQAIRIVSKLQRLNLSYTQIASILKYTRGAYEKRPNKDEEKSYLKKKPGFYYSEKEFVKKVCETLEIENGNRFPLTYIMEAADDISYLTADIEDAVDKGILKFDDVYTLIKEECEKENNSFLLDLVKKHYDKAKAKEDEPYQFNMFLTMVRANLITALVNHVSEIFVQNHKEVFDGNFNGALLEHDKESKYYKSVKILQTISIKHIYQNKEVQALELKGFSVINGLLDIYKPLLNLTSEDFTKVINNQRVECFISELLVKRLSKKQIVAYVNDVKNIDTEDKTRYNLLEWYYRVRLISDYVSGMTDDFALNEYQNLSAMT
jgi:dGTPase